MKKSELKALVKGSAAYVLAHGQRQKSRGRCYSAAYKGIMNPRAAFVAALKDSFLEKDGHPNKTIGKKTYNVVFCYNKEAGGYRGVRTWTSFPSKEYFDQWYTPRLRAREKIVEEGVTEERAIALVNQTPLPCYLAAGIEDAIDPESGEINLMILNMNMTNIALSRVF